MSTRPSSIRIPEETRKVIEEVSRHSGRHFSAVANEMLEEAVRMRRIPGVVFADGPLGRVARIAGTGLEVYEVIRTHRQEAEDWERLRESYQWLSEQQLRAALAYAEAYRGEIDEALRDDARWTPEAVWTRYPFTRPPWR